MLSFRSFRNTDPHALASIWRSRADCPWLFHPISPDVLEQYVFAKLYFDYSGLILGFEDERPVGFVHAGFGPDGERSKVATDTGIICFVLVRPDCPQTATTLGLLEQAEQYLARRGATEILGGAMSPFNPFYTGLYDGTLPPGILAADSIVQDAYRARGYGEARHTSIFRLDLTSYRQPADRQQLQLRRRMLVQVTVDPLARDWWEACTCNEFDLTRFDLIPRGGGPSVAHALVRDVVLRDLPPMGRAVGILELEVDPTQRRQGLGMHLFCEMLRTLSGQGVTTVEIQAQDDNPAALYWCRKLGLRQFGQGTVFRKQVG